MESLTIRPILGLKTDVPQNDPSLFNGEACHCVQMENVDLDRIRNASTKATGKTQYTSSANAQKTRCTGLMELRGTTIDHLVWDNWKFNYIAGDRSQTNVDNATPVTFSQTDAGLMVPIRVGNYVIMTDRVGTVTPQKWKNGDANLTSSSCRNSV